MSRGEMATVAQPSWWRRMRMRAVGGYGVFMVLSEGSDVVGVGDVVVGVEGSDVVGAEG